MARGTNVSATGRLVDSTAVLALEYRIERSRPRRRRRGIRDSSKRLDCEHECASSAVAALKSAGFERSGE